jgi:glycyl-tRNA synthetase beta chain
MQKLLLEIGTEEIPASFLKPAAVELERRVRALLAEHEIAAGAAEPFYTPRRIALRLSDVPEGRPAQDIELQGPPKKAAFDPAGNPTRTAHGFSAAHGKTPADLYVKTTPRGEYVFLRERTEPVPTGKVLAEKLPKAIASLPFPKNMRWDGSGLRFARPVRWVLCILGRETVRLRLDGLEAGNRSWGHRNSRPLSFRVTQPDDYERLLKEHHVIASHDARRETIVHALSELAGQVGGRPILDEELVEETADITESPGLLLCSFQPEYLELPAQVLITALKKHQRCFSVGGEDGRLLPDFIAVTNNSECNAKAVACWYERAAESRLKDARFFFQSDMARGLAPLVEAEKQVTWIEGMGSYFDKTERLREFCRHLSGRVPGTDAARLDRAAYLSKADLLTDMVREKEYTSLEGVMGGAYARLLGEPAAVADAIAEQYLPRFVGDALPQTHNGTLLSIADKVDNVVATFLTGAIPSGSEDPFALRRQATGLLTMVLEKNLPVDIAELIDTALARFPNPNPEYSGKLPDFFRERLAALLAERGISYDLANAALESFWPLPGQAMARAQALAAFRDQPEFERLIVGQKRVANILRGQKHGGVPDPQLLIEPTEKQLWEESRKVEPELTRALSAADYARAFELLLGLRLTIDKFFDDVMVMAKDERLRANRLRLLGYVRSLFGKVADLSKVVLEGEQQS